MSIRSMKWHIYDTEHLPLCWEGKALEFDFDIDAKDFLNSALKVFDPNIENYRYASIKQDILYYDGGYLNATDLRVGQDEENREMILVKKN